MKNNTPKPVDETNNIAQETLNKQLMGSKYRMIIVAAQRSKQLQRGARPRVELDPLKHKSTRIALEEVAQGKINYKIIEKE